MTRKPFSRHSLEFCTLKLRNWTPFFISSDPPNPTAIQNVNTNNASPQKTDASGAFYDPPTKKLCQSDPSTDLLPSFPNHMDFLGVPSLRLMEDKERRKKMSRRSRRPLKRRHRTRRDRSELVVSLASASDFPILGGRDSSEEFLLNCNPNWVSVDSRVYSRKAVFGDRRNVRPSSPSVLLDTVDPQGSDPGYASEPGYKGDVECECEDDLDDDDDGRTFFGCASNATDMDVEDNVEEVATDALL